jgi:hypothetical protein
MEFDDNKQRCRPTIEFIKAENQLLHYGRQAIGDDLFRQRLGIMDAANIKLGGIIIGRSDRLLKGGRSASDDERATESLNIRNHFFYSHHGIRVFTWTTILEYLRPSQ